MSTVESKPAAGTGGAAATTIPSLAYAARSSTSHAS
jgi:hypothetical protein